MSGRTSSALLMWLALWVCAGVWAAPLRFEAPPTADAPAVSRALQDLARQALQEEAGALSPRDAADLKLAVGQYAQAALGDISASAERGFLLHLYALTKALEVQEGLSFQEAFLRTAARTLGPVDDRSAAEIWRLLDTSPAAWRGQLRQRLAGQARGEIALADALELIRQWLSGEAAEQLAAVLAAGARADEERRYRVEEVLIKTPSGAQLSASVVRKRVNVRQPAALRFTIYVMPMVDHYYAQVAALHGYVGVVAYARGKMGSPDKILPWEHEVEDTTAVIDWIARQPWSDGQVGMLGASYEGFTQWAAAKHPHPALKTIVPGSASFPGYGLPMQNNVFQSANYAWPFYVMNNRTLDEATYNDPRWLSLNERWYRSGRPYRDIDAVDGTPNPLLQRQLQHPAFDAYWQAMQPHGTDYAHLQIPVLTMTGYFDDANAAAVDYLVQHYRQNPKAQHYLVVGPYPHAQSLRRVVRPFAGGQPVDPVARIDSLELTFQWFDHVMRGGPLPALLKDRINFEVMGADRWEHAPSIAAMSRNKRRLYLSVEGEGRHPLSMTRPAAEGFLEQTVDLADRSPETELNLYCSGTLSEAPTLPGGLLFVGEPLEKPLTVAGMITGRLDLSASRRDLDVTLAVGELLPDGQVLCLSSYVGRVSYAQDPARRRLLTPGRRIWIEVTRTPVVARQMARGSRLLLALSVNKNRFAQVNLGTGKDVSTESVADAGAALTVRWYNDSFLTLPVSP